MGDCRRAESVVYPDQSCTESASELPIVFRMVRDSNLAHLKALNQALFPINYQDKFYRDCMAFEDVTQLAYHDGQLVGGIACRLEHMPPGKQGARLYIMTLGVLAPYRQRSVGSRLLQRALAAIEFDDNITEAYLHVQTSNDDALKFYARFGFQIVDTIRNYYRRLDPPDCYVVAKQLHPVGAATN